MHCLFWVDNTPRIDVHGKQAVADFIDKYVTCSIPEENDDSELRKIVLDVQQHSKKHSKSCKKMDQNADLIFQDHHLSEHL